MAQIIDVLYPTHLIRMVVKHSGENIDETALAAAIRVAEVHGVPNIEHPTVERGAETNEPGTPIPEHPLCELLSVTEK